MLLVVALLSCAIVVSVCVKLLENISAIEFAKLSTEALIPLATEFATLLLNSVKVNVDAFIVGVALMAAPVAELIFNIFSPQLLVEVPRRLSFSSTD
jgi:hypothetical protein